MSKIVFFEIEPWEEEYLKKLLINNELVFTKQKIQDVVDQNFFSADIISPFIYSKVDQETIEKFPNLKFISTRSTGYDHIDLSTSHNHSIQVANVPTYGAHTVAEHTFALLLAISRRLIPTVEQSRRGNFHLDGLRGFDLFGKTIGIIGAGEIGKKVVELSVAFGMNVLIYTRHPEENKQNIRYVSFEDLLKSSDIVSLHVPFTPETYHLINQDVLKFFKKGSILINTSRGQLVESHAILEGLKTGVFKAVGLDVLEEEGQLKEERELLTEEFLQKGNIATQLLNHVLLTRDDVLFTSHNAFNSEEALHQILDITVDNIKSFLSGTPQHLL